MRTYERTHPWISFTFDARRVSLILWMKLGEAQSKCEHAAGVPLRPGTASRLLQVYLAKGVSATTAIEGNTLSPDDVLKRVEGTLDLPPSKLYLGMEVDNVLAAYNGIVEDIVKDRPSLLTAERIKQFNALVLRGLDLPSEVRPGELRGHVVGVGRYRGAPPEDCEYLLDRTCKWLDKELNLDAISVTGIAAAILKAILGHLYLAWIHPFGDGNGRTARLVEFQVLVSAGVPTTAAHLLSNHYNETRSEYYRQLEYASASGGDVTRFLEYAIQGFVDGLQKQIRRIQKEQRDVTWRNYVYERFGKTLTEAEKRRRTLVLDLSHFHGRKPVPFAQLKKTSPGLVEAYQGRTSRTLTRDVNRLQKMGLLERLGNNVRARTEVILAFLPVRRRKVAPKPEIPAEVAPLRRNQRIGGTPSRR